MLDAVRKALEKSTDEKLEDYVGKGHDAFAKYKTHIAVALGRNLSDDELRQRNISDIAADAKEEAMKKGNSMLAERIGDRELQIEIGKVSQEILETRRKTNKAIAPPVVERNGHVGEEGEAKAKLVIPTYVPKSKPVKEQETKPHEDAASAPAASPAATDRDQQSSKKPDLPKKERGQEHETVDVCMNHALVRLIKDNPQLQCALWDRIDVDDSELNQYSSVTERRRAVIYECIDVLNIEAELRKAKRPRQNTKDRLATLKRINDALHEYVEAPDGELRRRNPVSVETWEKLVEIMIKRP